MVDSFLGLEVISFRVIFKSFILNDILFKILRIDSIWVINAAIKFAHSNKLSTCSCKKFRGPIAHISESLNYELFPFKSGWNFHHFTNLSILQYFFSSIVDSQTRRLSPSFNAPCNLRLASGHSITVNILMSIVILISGLHPIHFPFRSPHIRPRNIHLSPNRVFFRQFYSILSTQPLQFPEWVIFRVDCNSPFCTSIGQVDNGTFQSHQTGEGLNFCHVNIGGISGATFSRQLMGFVLASVAWNSLKLSVIWILWSNTFCDDHVALYNIIRPFIKIEFVSSDSGVNSSPIKISLNHSEKWGSFSSGRWERVSKPTK